MYPIVYLNIMYLSKCCDFSESILKPRACVPEHGLGILRSASKAAFYICMPTDTQGLTVASKGPQRQQSSTEAQQRPNRSPAEAHSSPQSPNRCPGMQSLCFYVFSRVCDLYMFSRATVKYHFTCFCVYLRSRAGWQKSKYAVYTCFYVFPGSPE